jgi:hypothetical protein
MQLVSKILRERFSLENNGRSNGSKDAKANVYLQGEKQNWGNPNTSMQKEYLK